MNTTKQVRETVETEQLEQWAIDAAKELTECDQFRAKPGTAIIHWDEIPQIAAIIARHAPRHGASFNDLHRYATERDVRIAELERNNEALRIANRSLAEENERLTVELDRAKTFSKDVNNIVPLMLKDRDRTIEALLSSLEHLQKSEMAGAYTNGFCEVIAKAHGDRK